MVTVRKVCAVAESEMTDLLTDDKKLGDKVADDGEPPILELPPPIESDTAETAIQTTPSSNPAPAPAPAQSPSTTASSSQNQGSQDFESYRTKVAVPSGCQVGDLLEIETDSGLMLHVKVL